MSGFCVEGEKNIDSQTAMVVIGEGITAYLEHNIIDQYTDVCP